MYLLVLLFWFGFLSPADGITCYTCESYKDHMCLDPFSFNSIQENCDTAHWVRDKKPVFCEKRSEIVDGRYVTTRGCSIDYRWEDVSQYTDYVRGHIPCIRLGRKETCLCSTDRCNAASFSHPTYLATIAATFTVYVLQRTR